MAVRNVTIETRSARDHWSTQTLVLQEAQQKLECLESDLEVKKFSMVMLERKAQKTKEQFLQRLEQDKQTLMEQRQRPLPLKGEEMAASQRAVDQLQVQISQEKQRKVEVRIVFECDLMKMKGWWPAVDDFPVSQVLEMNREDTAEALLQKVMQLEPLQGKSVYAEHISLFASKQRRDQRRFQHMRRADQLQGHLDGGELEAQLTVLVLLSRGYDPHSFMRVTDELHCLDQWSDETMLLVVKYFCPMKKVVVTLGCWYSSIHETLQEMWLNKYWFLWSRMQYFVQLGQVAPQNYNVNLQCSVEASRPEEMRPRTKYTPMAQNFMYTSDVVIWEPQMQPPYGMPVGWNCLKNFAANTKSHRPLVVRAIRWQDCGCPELILNLANFARHILRPLQHPQEDSRDLKLPGEVRRLEMTHDPQWSQVHLVNVVAQAVGVNINGGAPQNQKRHSFQEMDGFAVVVFHGQAMWQAPIIVLEYVEPKPWYTKTKVCNPLELEMLQKEQQIAESRMTYDRTRMLEEDVQHTASQMVRCQMETQKEKVKINKQIAEAEGSFTQQQECVIKQEEEANKAKAKFTDLKEELTTRGDAAVLAKILRRATLPEGVRRPRHAMQMAKQIKMDWCCITAAADSTATSMSIPEFMDTLEYSVLQELVQTHGDRSNDFEFLFWFASNNNQDGRYLKLNTQLWPKLHSPLYRTTPTQLNFFELLRASLGDSQFDDVWLVPGAPHFHERALGLDRMKDFRPPQAVASHLRPYQLAGFRWLACLCKNGLGAVLADDMGLGKTLQCISVLLYMKEQSLLTNEQNEKCPALVVVPPGLLQNWQRELAQWAPSLSFYVYHGPKRSLPENKGKDYDLLLTTYEMVRNDRAKLADARVIAFCGMVIDEAQKIKNHGALVSKAVKEVGNAIGHTRIALSGTPIENKVDELHSIFDFVNYGYLGTQENFSNSFSKIIEKGKNLAEKKESLELLKRLTAPFQMRRLKTDPNILPDLPEKIELASSTHLTKEQQKLYQAIQDDFKTTMLNSREQKNHAFQRRGHIFAMLEHVRRVCSHPLCLQRDRYPESCQTMTVPERIESSGKTARLIELLEEEVLPANQKAVIFATRIDIVRLLEKLISNRFKGIKVLTFMGELSLQERTRVEKSFQTEANCKVLVMMLQCGGIGLNLTAANHVIHFDRCYNPAREAQATDRCHRLGQTRAVCVHRLITEGTYEEQLEKIMARKQDLSSMTVTRAEDWIADYDDEALFDLFMLRTGDNKRQRRASSSMALPSNPSRPSPAAPAAPKRSAKRPADAKAKPSPKKAKKQ